MIHNLDAIKEQAARHIRKVVEGSAKVDWKKSGSRLMACCPLHDEKSPSFFIDERQGLFHCFGCNKGGDAFSFLQEREALDFPGSVVRAAEILGITVEYNGIGDLQQWRAHNKAQQDERAKLYQAAEQCAAAFHKKLLEKPADRYDIAGRQYLADTVGAFRLGLYDVPPAKADLAKRVGATLMRDRVIFPLLDAAGRVVGFSGRVTGKASKDAPKYINSPGPKDGEIGIYEKSETLFGLFQNAKNIRKSGHVFLVEGPTDVLSLYEIGLPAVACCGTAFTSEHAKILSRYAETVTLLFDADEAGRKAARRAILSDDGQKSVLANSFADIGICFLPDGHDPDSFSRENPGQFQKYIDDNRTDAITWYCLDGQKMSTVGGKKIAIDRAKGLFRFLEPDRRNLYTKDLETRLGIPDLWRLIRPDGGDVDAEEIIKQAKEFRANTGPVVAFPVDALPPVVQAIVKEWVAEMKLPAEYFAGSILTVAGAAIGNKFVSTWRGRVHPAVLYSVLVGPSGDGKTPVHMRALQPLWEIDKDAKNKYLADRERWRQAQFSAKTTKGSGAPVDESLPEPKRMEIIIKDATTEKIVKLLESNGLGCLTWQNEFKSFLAALTRYSSGDSLGFWLDMYDALPYKRQRTSEETIDLEFPFCPMLTGIQPGILKDLAEGDKIDSGYFARLSFFYPQNHIKARPEETDRDPDTGIMYLYSSMVNRLFRLPSKVFAPTEEIPYWQVSRLAIPLSDEAKALYHKWLCDNTDKYNAEENDTLKSIGSKAESLVMRLALILHLMRFVTEQDESCLPNTPEAVAGYPIQKDDLSGAIALAEYLRYTSGLVLSRFESPVNTLPEDQRAWYKALPPELSTKTAVEAGAGVGVSERTVKRLLSNQTFFINLQRGNYRKRHE